MGSIPTRRIYVPKGIPIAGPERERPPTGVPASEGERQAANRLAAELKRRGLRAEVEAIAVRPSEAGSVALHAAISLGGGLLGMKLPLLGAAICLAVAFSFYAERALGLNLLGRLVPKRSSQNVVSPPTGPDWKHGVGIVLTAGYDIPDAYPVGEWLSRHLSGRLTSDRVVLWGGMIPLFVATMLRAAGIDSFGAGLIQLLSSAVLLTMIGAQLDRRLAGRPVAGENDPAAPAILFEALDELLDSDDRDLGVAVCLFGSESASAAGAADFFRRAPRELGAGGAGVINFIAADESAERVQITAREGDLATLKMSTELAAGCELDPEAAILRSMTAAVAARRRGIRAITVIGNGDDAVDTGLDLADAVLESAAAGPAESEPAGPDRPGPGDHERVGQADDPAQSKSGAGDRRVDSADEGRKAAERTGKKHPGGRNVTRD